MPAGEAYLGLLAETLEQYRRNTNDFFRLYTHEPHRTNKEKDENPVGILSSTGPGSPRSFEGSRTTGAFAVPSVVVGCVM